MVTMIDSAMQNIQIHEVSGDEFPALAAWLVRVNQAPENQCLHSWTGQSVEALQEQLLRDWEADELHYSIASVRDNWVGSIGAEYDEALGRAWIHGPHVMESQWGTIASELYLSLSKSLPASIQRYDAYLNIENQFACRFYKERGYKERPYLSFEFCLTPETRVETERTTCDTLQTGHHVSFKELFSQIFPSAYYSPERIIQMSETSHRAFVMAKQDTVLGFAVLSVNKGSSAGEIQFLGVREGNRRKGYGHRLLLSAVDWFLDEGDKSEVCLNVDDEKVEARSLYEGVGFNLQYTGIGLSKILRNSPVQKL